MFPRRYQDMSQLTDITSLREGDVATVLARVKTAATRRTRKGEMLNVVITDGNADLHLAFFRGIRGFKARLQPGRIGLFSGKVGSFNHQLQLAHPLCALAPMGEQDDPEEVEAFLAKINPIYPATASIPTWRVAQAVKLVLDAVDLRDDPLDETIRSSRNLVSQAEAFERIHRPTSIDQVDPARDRFRY